MPDLASRSEHERAVQAAVSSVFARYRDAAPNPGTMSWSTFVDELREAIAVALAPVYADAAAQVAGLEGLPLGPDAFAIEARDWSRQYAEYLARQIAETTRQRVAEALREERTREELLALWLLLLGDDRALTIGITEVTATISRGEASGLFRVEAETGKRFESIWNTADDDKVCPICRPLDQKTDDEWQREHPAGPPAHPNCRCYLIYRVVQ